jgi:hypothetical protein
MKVLRSTDMGKSFTETKSAPAFPKEDGRALANIWALEAGSDRTRDRDRARSQRRRPYLRVTGIRRWSPIRKQST